MWRSLLAVILLPSLTAAQAPPEVKPELSNDTSQATLEGDAPLTSTSEPLYQSYTRHDAIRRGREEDIGILLKTAGFVTAAKSPVSGVLPLKQEFEPLQGITVREVHGPKVQESFFTFQSERVMATGSPYVSFKIRADRNAPLGQQVLRGKFTFQQFLDGGRELGPVEQVDVRIPLTVVEHDAAVQKADFPYAPMPVWKIVLWIVAAPVLIAIVIPIFFYCMGAGTCAD